MTWGYLSEEEVHDFLESILRNPALNMLVKNLNKTEKRLCTESYIAGQLDLLFLREEIDEELHQKLITEYCS